VAKMQVKSVILGLVCFFCSNILYADYDVANLQKLFTDKKQRAQINASRSGKQTHPELKKTNKISVSGFVTRTDGKSVAWVNNKNTLDKTSVGDIKVHQKSIGKNRKVGLTVDGKHVRIKPGETWHIETGKIVDIQ
jgi:hypothetical protein